MLKKKFPQIKQALRYTNELGNIDTPNIMLETCSLLTLPQVSCRMESGMTKKHRITRLMNLLMREILTDQKIKNLRLKKNQTMTE